MAPRFADELRRAFVRCPGCGRDREQLRQRYSNCQESFYLTLEHIIPKSLGGTRTRENMMIICRSCNTRRGNQMPWDWYGQQYMIFKDSISNRQRKRMERREFSMQKQEALREAWETSLLEWVLENQNA